MAEMSFTILDWQIIERMTNPGDVGFSISSIDHQRILQLCFNILPGVKTVVHKLVDAGQNLSDLQGLFYAANGYKLRDLTKNFFKAGKINNDETCCTVPILEDVGGETALDYALASDDNP